MIAQTPRSITTWTELIVGSYTSPAYLVWQNFTDESFTDTPDVPDRARFIQEFFGLDSVRRKDGRPTNVAGINLRGQFARANGTVLKENGLEKKTDLQAYPLTYAAGHPFYGTDHWGYLRGSNWSDYLNRVNATTLDLQPENTTLESSILVVENDSTSLSVLSLYH